MEDWVANPNVFQSYDSDEVDDVGNDEDEEDDPDDEEYKYDVDADTLDTDMREAFPQGRTIKSLQRLKQYIYFCSSSASSRTPSIEAITQHRSSPPIVVTIDPMFQAVNSLTLAYAPPQAVTVFPLQNTLQPTSTFQGKPSTNI